MLKECEFWVSAFALEDLFGGVDKIMYLCNPL